MGVIAYHGVGLPRLESLVLGDYAFNTGKIAVFASWSCFGVLSKGLSRLQSASLVWSRSVVVSMRCLKVGFSFRVSHKDLHQLQSASFGEQSFRDCISVVLESSFIAHV